MPIIAGCTITRAALEAWSAAFVVDPAPYFLDDDLRARLPYLVTPRAAFGEGDLSLSVRDSYFTFAVHHQAAWVALITDDDLAALPPDLRADLLDAQRRFGRGQVYQRAQIAHWLDASLMPESHFTGEGEYLLLTRRLWDALTVDAREAWLLDFVGRDQLECLSGKLEDAQWARIDQHSPAVRHLAGRFLPTSGPNCFSTTLAALLRDQERATLLSTFWLHQQPFMEHLITYGYRHRPQRHPQDADLHDAVLVWRDQRGMPQHAAYLLFDGLVLNKNAQTWYAPRQIVALDALLRYWQDDPFEVEVYTR